MATPLERYTAQIVESGVVVVAATSKRRLAVASLGGGGGGGGGGGSITPPPSPPPPAAKRPRPPGIYQEGVNPSTSAGQTPTTMSLAAPNNAAVAAAAAALEQAPNALSQSMDSVNTVSAEEEVSPLTLTHSLTHSLPKSKLPPPLTSLTLTTEHAQNWGTGRHSIQQSRRKMDPPLTAQRLKHKNQK